MSYINLPYENTKRLVRDIFKSYGFSDEESGIISDVILTADLYSIESHGIQRMVRYNHEIKSGMVDVEAAPKMVWDTPVSAVIDAKKSNGHLVSHSAMRLAIEKAENTGIGIVNVRGSNHYGIAGYYSKMAADKDFIGICMTNSEAIMVPTNGRAAMLGTNPISVSMPADPRPFLFDASTTVVTRGKLEVYRKKELPLPEGWAVNAEGFGSVLSNEVLNNIIGKTGGGILPLGGSEEISGGHKGYGFGMICELFTSILAGGPPSYKSYIKKDSADTSHCFWVLDYGLFGEKSGIRRRFSEFLEDLRRSPRIKGRERIYLHGEKELESCERLMAQGIPANPKTVEELKDIAGKQGLNFAEYFEQAHF